MFITDNTDQVLHRHQIVAGINNWSDWSLFGNGTRLHRIAAETSSNGRIELFGVNSSGTPFHCLQTTSNSDFWSACVPFDGSLSTIAAARNQDGRLEVVGTNSANTIFRRVENSPGSDTWTSNWVAFPVPDSLVTVAAETNSTGQIELFGVNSSGTPFHSMQTTRNSDNWSSWAPFDGSLSTIAAARNQDGRLEVVGTNSANTIFRRVENSPGSDTWTSNWVAFPVPDSLVTLATETNTDGRVEIFGINGDGAIFHTEQSAAGTDNWLPWSSLTSPTLYNPSLSPARFEITFQAPDGSQRYIDPNGSARRGVSELAAGSSPSIAGGFPNGGYESSFTSGTNTLWVDSSSSGGHEATSQYTVRPGTSPSIAYNSDGVECDPNLFCGDHWMAVMQDTTGRLDLYDSLNNFVPTSYFAAAGSSPAIAGVRGGSYYYAFVDANSGQLRVADSWTGIRFDLGSGLSVAPGTDPAISSVFGSLSFEVAFQGADHHLWTVDWAGHQTQYPYVLEPTSGVAITWLQTGGYEIVFETGDGLLHKIGPDGVASLVGDGLGMAAHTRPAIGLRNGAFGYEIAFHAKSDTVWYVDPNNLGLDTGQPIAANTSPAIAAITDTIPSAPDISPLQINGSQVSVSWVDRSTNEDSFEVEEYSLVNGYWLNVYGKRTDDVVGTGRSYTYTYTPATGDPTTGVHLHCLRVLVFNSGGYAASQQQCDVTGSSISPPSTIPDNAKIWQGLSNVNNGTGPLSRQTAAGSSSYLHHSGQTFGVNLDFSSSPSPFRIWGIDQSKPMMGQLVALQVPQGGWLKMQHQDFGIDLGFDTEQPSYEWWIVGGTPGSGSFALWNTRQRDFLIYNDSAITVDLAWVKEVSDSGGGGSNPPVAQPAAAQTGVGFLRMFNCAAAHNPVSVWVKDGGGSYQKISPAGGLAYQSNTETGCVAKDSQPLTFTPVATHTYQLVVTDPLRTGCTTDDPSNSACVVEPARAITGNPAGAIETTVVGVGTDRSPFAFNALNG